MRFLAFVFGWWVFRPYSQVIAWILRAKGVRVGKGFYIQGVPYLKVRGSASNIVIGDHVSIHGDIDLRNRENGKIIFEDHVNVDTSCRFIAANDAVVRIKKRSRVGAYCIFNCGTDVIVGEDVLISGFCYVQSSNHGYKKGDLIRNQPHTYGKITIGNDVWLGSHVSILAGSTIHNGAIIGAKALVTNQTVDENSICVGIPAHSVGVRPG